MNSNEKINENDSVIILYNDEKNIMSLKTSIYSFDDNIIVLDGDTVNNITKQHYPFGCSIDKSKLNKPIDIMNLPNKDLLTSVWKNNNKNFRPDILFAFGENETELIEDAKSTLKKYLLD